jgi:hypothetical protein
LGTTADALKEKSARVQNLALAADLGFLATAVTAGVSLIWTLSNHRQPPADAARLEVRVTPSSLSLRSIF